VLFKNGSLAKPVVAQEALILFWKMLFFGLRQETVSFEFDTAIRWLNG